VGPELCHDTRWLWNAKPYVSLRCGYWKVSVLAQTGLGARLVVTASAGAARLNL